MRICQNHRHFEEQDTGSGIKESVAILDNSLAIEEFKVCTTPL
jgi:hypothetical protein